MSNRIQIEPIGTVHVEGGRYYLQLLPPYRDALTKLEGFSHIHVLFWGNQCDEPEQRNHLIEEKPYVNGPEQVGVFATRSEFRPNPILMTIVPVLNINQAQGLVELAFIDALDGSPLLDIKPYLSCTDRVRTVSQAQWADSWPQWYEDSASFDWSAVFNF